MELFSRSSGFGKMAFLNATGLSILLLFPFNRFLALTTFWASFRSIYELPVSCHGMPCSSSNPCLLRKSRIEESKCLWLVRSFCMIPLWSSWNSLAGKGLSIGISFWRGKAWVAACDVRVLCCSCWTRMRQVALDAQGREQSRSSHTTSSRTSTGRGWRQECVKSPLYLT